jgi:hypothetical protein
MMLARIKMVRMAEMAKSVILTSLTATSLFHQSYSFPKSFVPTVVHASTSPYGLRSARTDTAPARPERTLSGAPAESKGKSKGEHSVLRNISFRFPIVVSFTSLSHRVSATLPRASDFRDSHR